MRTTLTPFPPHVTVTGLIAALVSAFALFFQYQSVILAFPHGPQIVAVIVALAGVASAFGLPVRVPVTKDVATVTTRKEQA